MKNADVNDDEHLRKQILIDTFHGVRTTITLIHPIAQSSCERVREYVNINKNIWNWDYIFDTIYSFMDDNNAHKLDYLEPQFDFLRNMISNLNKNKGFYRFKD